MDLKRSHEAASRRAKTCLLNAPALRATVTIESATSGQIDGGARTGSVLMIVFIERENAILVRANYAINQ